MPPAAGHRRRAGRRLRCERRASDPVARTAVSTASASCGRRWHAPATTRPGSGGPADGIAGITGVGRGHHRTITTRRRPARRGIRTWSSGTGTHRPRPDQWWVADFTYVWTLAGFFYVSFSPTSTPGGSSAGGCRPPRPHRWSSRALEQALFTRRRTDARFTQRVWCITRMPDRNTRPWRSPRRSTDAGIAGSIGTVGDALDNALMESTIGLYKTELIDRRPRSGPAGPRSNARPPSGSTGSTPTGCTPRSTTYRRSSTNSATVNTPPATSVPEVA